MVNGHVDVELVLCNGCRQPMLQMTEVGGPDDGRVVAAHLSPDGIVQLGANLLRLARIAGVDRQLVECERRLVGWGARG